MRIKTEITHQEFSRLLDTLATETGDAAVNYERLHLSLVRFFRFRGCLDAETLADETINRVAVKLGVVAFDHKVKIVSYCFAFATHVYQEYLRELKRQQNVTDDLILSKQFGDDENDEKRLRELDACLARLTAEERALLIGYYAPEKRKADARRELAARFSMTIEALHTRVSRLRVNLRRCVEGSLNGN